MPLDPFLQTLSEGFAPLPTGWQDDIPALRETLGKVSDQQATSWCEPGPAVGERSTHAVAVTGGSLDVVVYHPSEPGPHPVHLYIHGGGWAIGSPHHDVIDIRCRERCIGARCVVVSVDYRKAPEHRFPTGLDDVYAVLGWVMAHTEELGIRADVVTIGGESAGGNLAAALALKVRDEGGPVIALQLLEIPSLDLTLSLPSHVERDGYALFRQDVEILRGLYLADPEQEASLAYVSPLLAPDLSGLPRTHIMTAEYDMLRDDGARYAERLEEAGVPVTHSLYDGHVHGSLAYTKVMASARAWRDEAIGELVAAHPR